MLISFSSLAILIRVNKELFFRTPAYRDVSATEEINVYFELFRPSDEAFSDRRAFTFKPSEEAR
jgi:hypothetical protein